MCTESLGRAKALSFSRAPGPYCTPLATGRPLWTNNAGSPPTHAIERTTLNDDEQYITLLKISESHTEAIRALGLALHATQTALSGVLRALGEQPQLLESVAREIGVAAERAQAVGLGSEATDDFLQKRNAVLHSLLPPKLRERVQLP